MRPTSQRMLELTDTPEGTSTREIVEKIWPETRRKSGRKRFPEAGYQFYVASADGIITRQRNDRLQHLLSKTRSALIIHERHGRVRQEGYAYGSYNNARSTVWKITDEGRAWLAANSPEKVDARRAAARATATSRAAHKDHCDKLLTEARKLYGNGVSPATRREVSQFLRAEGCTLQSIADIFGVTRELIRVDCAGTLRVSGARTRMKSQAPR